MGFFVLAWKLLLSDCTNVMIRLLKVCFVHVQIEYEPLLVFLLLIFGFSGDGRDLKCEYPKWGSYRHVHLYAFLWEFW